MIILFDLDSTLIKIEGFDEIGARKGIRNKIAEITKKTMDGELPFAEAFAQKLNILSPNLDDVEWLIEKCEDHIETNAIETIESLKQNGVKVGILSNGLEKVVKAFGQKYGFDMDYCIGLFANFDTEGNFAGLSSDDPLTKDDGKSTIIKSIKNSKNDKIIFVGDSAKDMEAGKNADLFVGYGGVVEREKVVRNAEHFAHNMSEVLEIIYKQFPELKI